MISVEKYIENSPAATITEKEMLVISVANIAKMNHFSYF